MKRTIIAISMTGAMVGLGVASAQAHTVAPGENLSSIAAKHGTTWQTLAKLNKLANPDKVYPGQHLKTPEKPKTHKKAPKSNRVASPVPGHGVNYPYGVANSGYAAGHHTGADHAAPTGAKVVMVTNGTVVKADGNGGSYGNWIQVKSTNGRTYMFAHLSQIDVKPGQTVKAGQKIGEVGTTGNSTGPHLHWEATPKGQAWSYGNVVNPEGTW